MQERGRDAQHQGLSRCFVERSEHAVYESRVDRVGLPGTEQREGRRPVGTVTVQRLLAEDCRYRPLIVKLDIEGAETGLLSSNTEWLDDVRRPDRLRPAGGPRGTGRRRARRQRRGQARGRTARSG